MTTKKPYRFDQVDFNKIKYGQVKHTDTKTIVYIKYEDNNKLNNFVVQTPKLYNCNDVIEKNGVFNLDVPLVGQSKEKVDLFIGFLNNLERKVIGDCKVNGHWFDNFIKDDSMKYQKIIRESDEYKEGVIRGKIIRRNDFQTILQYGNRKLIKHSDIPKNSWVKMLMEIYAIWVNENGFGIFIRPVLMSFSKMENNIYNYGLLESDSDDEDDVINTEVDSIFMRQKDVNNNDSSNNTSIIDLPDNYVENLSSTSSEEV